MKIFDSEKWGNLTILGQNWLWFKKVIHWLGNYVPIKSSTVNHVMKSKCIISDFINEDVSGSPN